MIYRLTWLAYWVLFRSVWRFSVGGALHVPIRGPVIIAANHLSYMDPPLLAVSLWRPCSFIAKAELFHSRWFGAYLHRLNAFPVRRGAPDRAALRRAMDYLARGMPLVIFPEGTRGESEEPGEPEMGIGLIAYRSGVPVVPAYIWGTSGTLGRKGGIRINPIGVRFGPPLRFVAAEGERPDRDTYEAAASQVMDAIRRQRAEWLAESDRRP